MNNTIIIVYCRGTRISISIDLSTDMLSLRIVCDTVLQLIEP